MFALACTVPSCAAGGIALRSREPAGCFRRENALRRCGASIPLQNNHGASVASVVSASASSAAPVVCA